MNNNFHTLQLSRMQSIQQYFGTACVIQASPGESQRASLTANASKDRQQTQTDLMLIKQAQKLQLEAKTCGSSQQYSLLRQESQQQSPNHESLSQVQPTECLPRLGLSDDDLRVLAAILCVEDRDDPM
ncbi:hypothetical protein FI667_g12375, partial [Globisporangium splendens]